MSDYMFILSSHLNAEQNRVLDQVQAAADAAGVSLFLTGGGMRDMLSQVPSRDLDFSVEGNALKVAKSLEDNAGAQATFVDENRKLVELLFPNGVTAQVSMARKERYAKTGAKPQVTPATIQEDLRGRDFTINAIALSLNRASRGLLMDPTNGLADLGHKEMRSTHPYVFYDDPGRLLRLERLRVRLGFTIEERTRMQFDNAREADVASMIPPRILAEEFKKIAEEPSPSELLHVLEEDGMLALFSPALTGAKLNLAGLARLEKAIQTVEFARVPVTAKLPMFLHALFAKLSPKDKAALIKTAEIPKSATDMIRTLESHAAKLEEVLKSARIRKPSQVYQALAGASGDEMAYLLGNTTHKAVQERIHTYLEKYLPAVQEIPPTDFAAVEGQPGTPKYEKNRQAFIAARLDAKPKPPEIEGETPLVPTPPPPEATFRGRRSLS